MYYKHDSTYNIYEIKSILDSWIKFADFMTSAQNMILEKYVSKASVMLQYKNRLTPMNTHIVILYQYMYIDKGILINACLYKCHFKKAGTDIKHNCCMI